MNIDILIFCRCGFCHGTQERNQLRVVFRFAGAKRRVYHYDGALHVGREYVTVVHLVFQSTVGMLKLFHNRSEQIKRVALDIVGKDSARREHEHLLVLLQLLLDISRLANQRVHTVVVVLREEIRDVAINKIRNVREFFNIHLCRQVFRHTRGILIGKRRDITFYCRHHNVGINFRRVAILEHGENFVCSGNILINIQGIVVIAVERKEVGNILLVV